MWETRSAVATGFYINVGGRQRDRPTVIPDLRESVSLCGSTPRRTGTADPGPGVLYAGSGLQTWTGTFETMYERAAVGARFRPSDSPRLPGLADHSVGWN